MRVTVLTASLPRFPGGGSSVYYRYAGELAARGHDVTVVHPLDTRAAWPGRGLDIARQRVRDLRARDLRRQIRWLDIDPRIERILVDRLDVAVPLPPADVRVATFWRTSEVLAARSSDPTPVVQLMQAYETWGGERSRVDAVWHLPWHKVVISHSLVQTARSLGVDPTLVHRVPNGLDHETFGLRLPVDGRPPVILTLAHESPVKGLSDAVTAFEMIRARRPDARFVAFGGTSRPRALPRFVEYHRSPRGAALARLYNDAAVFVCASRSEGWGFPSLESMACGAALVSVSNGGVDEFATHGTSALLAEPGDVAGLADCVLELLDDDALRTRIASAGRQRAAAFRWHESGELFTDIVTLAAREVAR